MEIWVIERKDNSREKWKPFESDLEEAEAIRRLKICLDFTELTRADTEYRIRKYVPAEPKEGE